VLRIIVVFSMITVFWALFDQHSSTWVEQAKSMDLTLVVPAIVWYWFAVPAMFVCAGYGALWLFRWVSNRSLPRWFNLSFFGAMVVWLAVTVVQQSLHGASARIDLLPAQIAALNPLLVMIIIPALNFAVYRPLDKRDIPLKPLQRIGIGMFLGATAFGAVALLQARIQQAGPGHIPVLWQLIPFTLLTTAEVLVSVTGLEFAYTQAPRAMKSTIMGFWLLCITMGNVLVAFLAPLESLSLETFFWTFAGLMLAAAVIFVILASFYRGKTYLQAG
jgi:dipeptide/tripeptide permease